MDFSDALKELKKGKKICRTGWNGKKQYIILADHVSYRKPDNTIQNANHETMGNQVIVFVGTIGEQVGWLASQADLLSNDWEVID